MIKNIVIIFCGVLSGIIVAIIACFFLQPKTTHREMQIINDTLLPHKRQVIGFLPYWLTDRAKNDYSPYISTLTYFGLALDTDGSILKMSNEQEEEPGWYALDSGKVDPFLQTAKKNNIQLSLLIFSGNNDTIEQVMNDPEKHADNLLHDVVPLMKKNNFSDLNLDIEYTKQASDAAQLEFTRFVKEVKKELVKQNLGTLTVEISPTDLIKKDLIHTPDIASMIDNLVIMAYDYHFSGSYVTGPVSPLNGVGKISEYDVQTAVQQAVTIMPGYKIILGIPLYGYEWETINDTPRSAVIPGTGIVDSAQHVEDFINSCTNCATTYDDVGQEAYTIYHDDQTGTYHQMFYPTEQATQAKVNFVNDQYLGGIALWALGYEDSSILKPIGEYK